MNDAYTSQPGFDTPEQAAAAVRNGRAGYVLTIQRPGGLWVAFGEHVCTTKEDARAKARAAILQARDASRIAVIGTDGKRLSMPTPRALKYEAPPTDTELRELTRKKGAPSK